MARQEVCACLPRARRKKFIHWKKRIAGWKQEGGKQERKTSKAQEHSKQTNESQTFQLNKE